MASNSQRDDLHDCKEWHLREKEIISIPYKGLSLSLVEPIRMTLGAYLVECKMPPCPRICIIILLSTDYENRLKLASMALTPAFLTSVRVMNDRL